MKIHRVRNGNTEYIAKRPLNVLGEDGVTIDHVETAWTSDEGAALDFTAIVPTAQHARDLAKQLEGTGAVLPAAFNALPEPKPRNQVPPPAPVRVETRDTTEGVALRARLAAERAAAAAEKVAREAAEEQEKVNAAAKKKD